MMRAVLISLALAALLLGSGCATDGEENDSFNGLWRQGYGFNNPNAERIPNKEPPLNFDGSMSK